MIIFYRRPPPPHHQITQFSEIDEVYPGWAQFIGAVIILMAVLPIPIVLIVRLILYQSARDEAVGFFKSLRTDAEDVFRYISHLRSVVLLLVLFFFKRASFFSTYMYLCIAGKFGGLAVYLPKFPTLIIIIYVWRSCTEPPNLNPPIFLQ